MGTDELESLYAQSAKAPLEAAAIGVRPRASPLLAAVDIFLSFRNMFNRDMSS